MTEGNTIIHVDGVSHTYCGTCIDWDYLKALHEVGRMGITGYDSPNGCEACGIRPEYKE
jgi:hypothetical protein